MLHQGLAMKGINAIANSRTMNWPTIAGCGSIAQMPQKAGAWGQRGKRQNKLTPLSSFSWTQTRLLQIAAL